MFCLVPSNRTVTISNPLPHFKLNASKRSTVSLRRREAWSYYAARSNTSSQSHQTASSERDYKTVRVTHVKQHEERMSCSQWSRLTSQPQSVSQARYIRIRCHVRIRYYIQTYRQLTVICSHSLFGVNLFYQSPSKLFRTSYSQVIQCVQVAHVKQRTNRGKPYKQAFSK